MKCLSTPYPPLLLLDDSLHLLAQGHQGVISITGTTEGAAIGLYTASGTLVATATAEGESTHLTVPTGQVYIVTVADTVVKIGM